MVGRQVLSLRLLSAISVVSVVDHLLMHLELAPVETAEVLLQAALRRGTTEVIETVISNYAFFIRLANCNPELLNDGLTALPCGTREGIYGLFYTYLENSLRVSAHKAQKLIREVQLMMKILLRRGESWLTISNLEYLTIFYLPRVPKHRLSRTLLVIDKIYHVLVRQMASPIALGEIDGILLTMTTDARFHEDLLLPMSDLIDYVTKHHFTPTESMKDYLSEAMGYGQGVALFKLKISAARLALSQRDLVGAEQNARAAKNLLPPGPFSHQQYLLSSFLCNLSTERCQYQHATNHASYAVTAATVNYGVQHPVTLWRQSIRLACLYRECKASAMPLAGCLDHLSSLLQDTQEHNIEANVRTQLEILGHMAVVLIDMIDSEPEACKRFLFRQEPLLPIDASPHLIIFKVRGLPVTLLHQAIDLSIIHMGENSIQCALLKLALVELYVARCDYHMALMHQNSLMLSVQQIVSPNRMHVRSWVVLGKIHIGLQQHTSATHALDMALQATDLISGRSHSATKDIFDLQAHIHANLLHNHTKAAEFSAKSTAWEAMYGHLSAESGEPIDLP